MFIFVLFSLQFQRYKSKNSVNGVLGIQTHSHRMAGADATTELWRPHEDFFVFTFLGKNGRESCSSQIVDSDRRISCAEAIGLTEMNRLRVPGLGMGLGDASGATDAESKLSRSEFRRSLRRINSITRRKLSPNGRAGGSR